MQPPKMERSSQQVVLERALVESQSPDPTFRRAAELKLSTAEKESFPQYVQGLAEELNYEGGQEAIRQLAGLLLKNAVSAKTPSLDKEKRDKWSVLPGDLAKNIRASVFSALTSQCEGARSAAAQVVAKLARIDLPAERWPELLPDLFAHATQAQDLALRKTAVTALGYLCEDMYLLSTEMGQDLMARKHRNGILSAVTHCARNDTSVDLALAGYRALAHALLFARENMETKSERLFIMSTLAEGLRHSDLSVRQAAWECVIQLATEYYEFLDEYIADLGKFSIETIQGAVNIAAQENGVIPDKLENVALAALEFWSSLCDVELIAADEKIELKDYIKQAQGVLLPVLFECLTCKNADENAYEDDEWTLAMAAATCLTSCAQILTDSILQPSLSFIMANFDATGWRGREAAVLVYGCIMEVPTTPDLDLLVSRSFQKLTAKLQDNCVAVRSTTAWALGRVIPKYPACVDGAIPSTTALVTQLMTAVTQDEPQVASYICFALHGMAQTPIEKVKERPLDKHFKDVCTALITAVKRPDSTESNLRASAFEALSEVVINATRTQENIAIMNDLLATLTAGLESTFTMAPSESVYQLQSLLCGCINALFEALVDIPKPEQHAALLLRVVSAGLLAATNGGSTEVGVAGLGSSEERSQIGSEEDAMIALGALVRHSGAAGLGTQFPLLTQTLLNSLQQSDQVRFCRACIGVISELAACLETSSAEVSKIIEQCLVEFMPKLLAALQNPRAPISLKPTLITTISDICVGLEGKFLPFVPDFLILLHHAASTHISDGPDEPDWMEYFQELRDAVLEAYTCLLHGMRNDAAGLPHLQQAVDNWLRHIETVLRDEKVSSENNVMKAFDVVMDLVLAFRAEMAAHLRNSTLAPLLKVTADKYGLQENLNKLNDVSVKIFGSQNSAAVNKT